MSAPTNVAGVLRACCRCSLALPVESFGKKAGKPYGRDYTCKPCASAARKARYWANPERHRAKSTAHYKKRPPDSVAIYAERKANGNRQSDRLTDSFIIDCLCWNGAMPRHAVTPELIAAKRAQLILGRAIKEKR